MPITEDFAKHLMEQNTALLAQNSAMAEHISQLTKSVESLNQTIQKLQEPIFLKPRIKSVVRRKRVKY